MLRNGKELKDYGLKANDGDIGSIKDFYFDDDTWTVRYMVVETGGWLSGRSVLISPVSVIGLDEANKLIRVSLSMEQVRNSPSVDTEKPVSRQYEVRYFGYYGWPMYWGSLGRWGTGNYPSLLASPGLKLTEATVSEEEEQQSHLRSSNEVSGYTVQARDRALGEVEDFIVDDETWAIRYMVIDTISWWPSKRVLVSPHWIDRIDWADQSVFVDLARRSIKEAPAYDRAKPITRDYEVRLFKYYGHEADIDAIRVRRKEPV